jgi:ferredoxin-NADP reductase/MOSC domain-containing protein YiiM/ferredoxin
MATLLSVNVGVPRDIPWEGKRVRTAIWKFPVEGRVAMGRINLAGDDQADREGHGGEHRAVLVYQIETHRYWAKELQRDDLEPGCFGENFTVSGLSDEEVCIGDRYRIGTAVFEVTQPRVTCFRMGIRLDRPDLPSLMVARRRPGFYMRVIQEGHVGKNDDIILDSTAVDRMSVADIDTLLYKGNRSTAQLHRAVNLPALSLGWRDSFKAFLDHPEDSPGDIPGWRGFRTLTVLAREQVTPDVVAFVLGSGDGTALPPARGGQHVAVRVTPEPGQPGQVRTYSLCGGPAGSYRIGIKRETSGISAYLHDHLQAGGTLETSAPRGSFVLQPGSTPVVLISAGIGITPLLGMLNEWKATGSSRPIWWIHGARDAAHLAFGADVDRLLSGQPAINRLMFYSHPDDKDGIADGHMTGRMSVETLIKCGVPTQAEYYVCGPDAFMHGIRSDLVAGGVSQTAIFMETFGTEAALRPGIQGQASIPPHLPAGTPGTGPIVMFARSRLAVPWDARYRSLLELAEACDVPVRWSCRTGVCQNCRSALLDGQINYFIEPLDPPTDNDVLICCARPQTGVELDL